MRKNRFALLPPLLIALPMLAFAGNSQTVVLDVQNMTCALCTVTVQKALVKVPGVADAKVDYRARTAAVRFDPEKTSPAALAKATANAGFPSKPHGAAKP